MKCLKNTGLLLAAVAVVCSLHVPSNAAFESYAPRDIDFHWAEDHINTLLHADILKGYNGYTNPDDEITRGEFCALTARALSLTGNPENNFTDIPRGHMFYNEINLLAQTGIVDGTGNGMFSPERTITREEMMLVMARCVPSQSDEKISFKDIAPGYKYISELKTAIGSGLINGYDDNTFRPYETADRAQCAAMLTRLIEAGENTDKDTAVELAKEYIGNDLKNPEENKDITIGRANDEINLKVRALDTMKRNGMQSEKFLSDITLKEYKGKGGFASLTFEGDISYVNTTLASSMTNTYKGTYRIETIQQNGKTYIYDSTLSLKLNDTINLTWEVNSTPPDYAPQGVNIVSPSSFHISAENLGVEKISLSGNIHFYNSLTNKYMSYAKTNGYMVWPIYKTDFTTKTAEAFLSNSYARMKAIDYIIQYACKYPISGINIDFENIYKDNRYLVTKHSRELATMLHQLGLVVSADVTRLEKTSANWSMCYDRDALAENCDYIMLMAYDEYYASSTSAGPVASLDWTEDAIKLTLQEVPEDKLVLGIPFYMRYFEVTGNKVTSTKAISMQTAYDLIQKNNPTYTYIEKDGQYKISWKSGNKTCVFWLENTDTVRKRTDLVKKYSLAGIASWRRGLEISKVWDVLEENLQNI